MGEGRAGTYVGGRGGQVCWERGGEGRGGGRGGEGRYVGEGRGGQVCWERGGEGRYVGRGEGRAGMWMEERWREVGERTDLGQFVLALIRLASSYVEEDLHNGCLNSLTVVEGMHGTGGITDTCIIHETILAMYACMYKTVPTFCRSADPFLWLHIEGERKEGEQVRQ